MIHCKPKKNTYFSLGIVLLMLFSGLVFLLNEFATQRNYSLVFYLASTSILTLVILMLLVKMMAGYKFISAGKDQIITRLPLRGLTKTYRLNQLLAWEEEKVMANKKEFRQLTIVFEDKNSFTISNHEHHAYAEFIQYLSKKAPKKRVSPNKKN